MSTDVKEFQESCVPCLAAVDSNTTPPMQIRETPDRPWQHCSADYKGPIGGKYYFHVLIDNYSRWPEVAMVTSTEFGKLQDRLEESFSMHGIPDSITHDNGPCYNSSDWIKFAKKWGFEARPCTPEHPQANGIAERFMGVLVKVVHAAVASNQDPRVEVRRRLLNYRNTPHPSTGKTPAELMIRRQIKTRVPGLMKSTMDKVDIEAKTMDKVAREKRKSRFDSSKHAKTKEVMKGDKVLVKQKKSSINPPFDPRPYTVTEVKGTQVTATRGGKERKRNQAKMKVVKVRPAHLQPQSGRREQVEDSDSDVDIQLDSVDFREQEAQVRNNLAQGLETDAGAAGGEEDQQQPQLQGGHAEPVDAEVRRSDRAKRAPKRYGDIIPEQKRRSQLSPRNRKRIKSLAARKVPKEEWKIRQNNKDNLVIVFQKKPQEKTG